jgi:hypothetical protein
MFRTILFSLVLLLLPQTVPAQCTKKISELPTAPELLGFRLGMTKEQIKAQVPQTKFGSTDRFGVAKTTINPYFDETIDKSKFPDVRSISLDLVDDKLTSIWIGFDATYKAHTADEFIKLLSQSLGVDETWSSRSRGQQLRCADFQLTVTTVAGGPSFRLVDTAADDLIAQRRQAKEEQDSLAEAGAATESTDEAAEIVADKKSKTYYPNGCVPEKQISETNKISFKTAVDAEKAGFKAAKNCH